MLGSSPEGSFLTRESPIWRVFGQGGQKRETDSIESEVNLREGGGVDLECPGLDLGILRFPVFSPKFTCFWVHNVTSGIHDTIRVLVPNYVRFRVADAVLVLTYAAISFLRSLAR